MICRRTWAVTAAAIIAFVASRFFSPAVAGGWDISEAGRPREDWVIVAVLAAAAAVVSLTADLLKRKQT